MTDRITDDQDPTGKENCDIGKMRTRGMLENKSAEDIPPLVEKNLKQRANELATLCRVQWLDSDIPTLAAEFTRDFRLAFLAGVHHGKLREARKDVNDSYAKISQLEPILKRLSALETLYAKINDKFESRDWSERYSIERRGL